MTSRSLVAAGLASLLLACVDGPPAPHRIPPPDLPASELPPTAGPLVDGTPTTPRGGNVLILVADDVGVDKIGIDQHQNTPNIDALAAEGMRFDHAWALPYCGPTRSALMTGRHARRTGTGSNAGAHSAEELDPRQVTLAEVVAESPAFSYDTSFVGEWHLSSFESPSGSAGPLIQGWNWFAGIVANPLVWFGPRPDGALGYYLWQKVDASGAVGENRTYVTTDNVNEAIGRLERMPEPWVMEVAFTAAHAPYDMPPAELVTSRFPEDPSLQVRTRAIIEALDTEIGRLLAAIPPETREATTIVFVGDNGTAELAVEDQIDPLRTKGSVYEPGIHVPLIVSGPLVGVPGSTSQALVHVVDLFPTVAEIAGVDLSTFGSVTDPSIPLQIDGESLVPLLADPMAPARRDVLYSERFNPSGGGPYFLDLRTVRDSRYKLILDAVNDIEQFFEYPIDGWDEGPDLMPCGLTPEQEEARARLRTAMDELVASMPFDSAPIEPDLPRHGDGSPLLTTVACVP